MKRIISILLITGLVLAVCGCGNRMLKLFKGGKGRYLYMSEEELSTLSDEALYEAIMQRAEHTVEAFLYNGGTWEDGVNALPFASKLVYSLDWLERELENGGIVQFFINSSRMAAPFISEYLAVIGATEHQKLYDDFIAENHIDVNDLSAFDIDDLSKVSALYEKYPSDAFTDAWYAAADLKTYLMPYIRKHLADF